MSTPHCIHPEPRYYTFWSINGELNQASLRSQLAAFQAAGLHGVVFHPRFYPGIPPYLSDDYLAHVSDTILHAKKLGLRFWLYDENGWPSGTGDGQVLANYPDSGAMRLTSPQQLRRIRSAASRSMPTITSSPTIHRVPPRGISPRAKSTTSIRSTRACSATSSS